MQTSLFRIETFTSPPVTIPGGQVYIRSQAFQFRFPKSNGGLIWNRPVASVVRTSDGQEKIIPILDVTRIILFTLMGICFTSLFVLMFLRRRKFLS